MTDYLNFKIKAQIENIFERKVCTLNTTMRRKYIINIFDIAFGGIGGNSFKFINCISLNQKHTNKTKIAADAGNSIGHNAK